VTLTIDNSLEGIDWARAKADLAADNFDNGRSPDALRRSFQQSQHVMFARDGDRVVGMARLLSDGVCNAYLVDVWTASDYRRQGVGSAMIARLLEQVPGQHVGLQTGRRAGVLRVARVRAAARVLVPRRRTLARQRGESLVGLAPSNSIGYKHLTMEVGKDS
jgi:GNAT superfamily N-acetyltransferase